MSVIPAEVSMTWNAKSIKRDEACVVGIAHIAPLIDVDQDIPVCRAVRIRVLMYRGYSPVPGPYEPVWFEPISEKEARY